MLWLARFIVRYLLVALFLFAGVVHLKDPGLFMPVMPPWIPWHFGCIVVSGVFELLGGVALGLPFAGIRRAGAIGLLLLLVAVFPANIYMAAAHVRVHGFPSHEWMAWARLPLQPLLMLAVFWAGDLRLPGRK